MSKPVVKSEQWYTFTNEADGAVRVDIYDFIGEGWDGRGVSARNFTKDLRAHKAKTLNVHINSDGGMITDATAIHTALRNYKRSNKAEIVVHIDGIAASAASMIAMAGDRILMAEPAFMMIHNPMGGAWGYADDLTAVAEVLNKMRDQIAKVYANRSGQSVEEVCKLMDAETWMTSDEAVELGFADAIDEGANPVKAAASAMLLNYRNTPASLKKLMNATERTAAPIAPVEAASDGNITMAKTDADAAKTRAALTNEVEEEDKPEEADDEEEKKEAVAEETPEATAEATAKVATVAELKAAIPTCTAEFREACIENGLSVAQAKAMHALTASAAGTKRAGGPGVKSNPASGAVNAGGDFMAVVRARMSADKCNYRTAASAVARENPDLHEAYVAAQKPQRSRPVSNGAAD